MAYTIEIVDVTKKNVEDELRALFKEGFGREEMPEEGYLVRNINSKASMPSFFVVAIEDGAFIGANGFIAYDFYFNGKKITGFESCWSATHPKHQGRKIFVSIQNFAKEYLKEKGAGFIFGMANDNSHPIFIKKLGFTEVPAMTIKIPNIPLVKNLFFNKSSVLSAGQITHRSLITNEEQVIALKQQEKREVIEIIKVNESFGWGKIRKHKKFGITFTYFYLGGISLKDPADYKKIIKKILSSYRIAYVLLVSSATSNTNPLLNRWKKARMNGFIYFDLNAGAFEHTNMMMGIIDVF